MKLKSLTYCGLAGAVGLATLVPAVSASAAPSAPAAVEAAATFCPKVVAHRGGEGDPTDANENSMGAFRRGADIGVDVMETDVWFTKDTVPVIMHDETLDRTTDATGKVSDYTWRYLRKNVRLNNGERIPSLREALEFFAFRDLPSFVEYKDADEVKLYRAYLKTMEKYGKDAWAAGFSSDFLNWVHKHDKKRDLMWFGNKDATLPATSDVPAGANPGLFNIILDDAKIATFIDAGYKMNVWFNTATRGDNPTGTPGVPGNKGWDYMTSAGVHWISTDYPDRYKEWTQGNKLCNERPAKTSTQQCLTLPKKMKPGMTYTILPRGCESSAGKKISVKVKASTKTAKVLKRQGSTLLKVKKSGGKVALNYTAPKRVWTTQTGTSWESYTAFSDSASYMVKAKGGTPANG